LPSLIPLFLFLHILFISVWIAGLLWLPGDVKRTLALGKPHVDALVARMRPALGLDAIGAVGTFASGILIMWAESWAPPRPGIAAGVLFAIARAFALWIVRRTARQVAGRVQAGEAVAPTDPAVKRMGMVSGIAHLLWVLALAGMVFPY
jgi:uncharacterized membrane protein